jgi:YHS domain-containing protein
MRIPEQNLERKVKQMTNQQPVTTSALVKDPVCGMDVDPRTAQQHAEVAGVDYYFSSAHCRAKFVADPRGLPLRPRLAPPHRRRPRARAPRARQA